MKKMKRLWAVLLALVVFAGAVFVAPPVETQAATKKIIASSKMRCGITLNNYKSLYVSIKEKNAKIKNVKTSSSQLKARVYSIDKKENETDVRIAVYAKKAGTYKLKYDVYKANGKKLAGKTVTVYASKHDGIYKSLKLNGKELYHPNEYYTSNGTDLKSAKFKITMNTGYKLKKLRVGTYDSKGKFKFKTFKNGQKITMGKYGISSTSKNAAGDSYWRKDYVVATVIEVTYVDTFSSETPIVKRSNYIYINSRATKWAKNES